jgi:integrase
MGTVRRTKGPTGQRTGPDAGKRWEVEWRIGTGRGSTRRSRTFTTKGEAKTFLTETEAQLARGAWVDPRDGRTTVADWAGQWLARVRVEPGTREQYETRLRTSVLPLIGDRQLGQVRQAHLEQVLTQARERLAPSTVATTWRITATMFRAAVRDGLIAASPCEGISVGRPPRKEVQVLDRRQLGALLAAARTQDRALLVTVVGTGLRQAEMFGLRRPRVDFLRRTLAVEEQVTVGTGRPPALTSRLKTAASRRRLPLPDAVLEVLSAHLAEHPDADVLFTTGRGALWRRGSFNDSVWKPTLRRAGLDEQLGFHVLRHTYASHLIVRRVVSDATSGSIRQAV